MSQKHPFATMWANSPGDQPELTMVGTGARKKTNQPTPFREFILKVHTRCNLACDYCYMYELADRSALTAVAAMSPATFDRTLQRIREHVATHGLPAVRVVLHGGEPLLLGVETLVSMARRLREMIPATVDISIQTNGVLLTGPGIDALGAAGVKVGVSVDGGHHANDRHRRYPNGRSSFLAVDRALRLLRDRAEVFSGVLCVIDLANDPADVCNALLCYAPPAMDVLLPHANWTSLPPGHVPGKAVYGEWLVAAFDWWYGASTMPMRIRLFEEVLHLLLGGASHTEAVGLSPTAAVVVSSDGSYEQVDTLRSSYPGAVGTGMTVIANSLDEVLAHPAIALRQAGIAALAPECLRCPVHRVCGGGNYPHRYRQGSGFLNPSVYCADLRLLIEHAGARLRADIAELKRPGQ